MRFEHTMRELMVLIHFQSIRIHELYIHYFLHIKIRKYIIVKRQEQMKKNNNGDKKINM